MRDPRNLVILGLAVATAFLAGLAVADRTTPAFAQQVSTQAGNGTVDSNKRMIAATGSVGSGMSVLWLVDTETNRVLVYGTSNLGKNVELRAARNIEWDLRLDEYRDESQYTSEDLRRVWERQRRRDEPAGPVTPTRTEEDDASK